MRAVQNCFALALVVVASCVAGCESQGAHEVSGYIRLAPGTVFTVQESDALFVTARAPGAKGPPLAVVKLLGVKFPLKYTVGQEDVLMPGTWFRGPVEVRATLRRSGFINIPGPTDLIGQAPAAVSPGSRDVNIELTREP